MKKITEHKIEQFIRFPHELSSDEKKQIENAIRVSDEMRRTYYFYKEFYAEYDRISGSSKNVIVLKPYSFKKSRKGPVVLAAMTGKTPLSGLKTLATLVSEKEKSVVRILEDQRDKTLQFHVLMKDLKQSERAILSLISPELDLVTNTDGKLKGVQELSDVSWEQAHTLLRLPVFKKEVHLTNSNSFTLKEVSDTDIWVMIEASRIILNFEVFPPKLTRVLWTQGKKTELKRIDQSQLSFTIESKEPGMLYFYE